MPAPRPLRRDPWRILYIAELVLIVLPLTALLLHYFVFLAFLSFGSVVVGLIGLLSGRGGETTDSLAFAASGVGIVLLTGVAVWQFVVLSTAYLKLDQMPVESWNRRFWGGLLASAIPLIASFGMALPILLPALHLSIFRTSVTRRS